jgi:hypothetical protein
MTELCVYFVIPVQTGIQIFQKYGFLLSNDTE